MCVHAKQRNRRASPAQQASRVDRSEGFLQIHAGRQLRDLDSGKCRFSVFLSFCFIRGSGNSSSRWGAPIALTANLQLRRTRLSQPLHCEAQRTILDLRIQHPPHGVSLRRPQVKQAAVVLARDRVFWIAPNQKRQRRSPALPLPPPH